MSRVDESSEKPPKRKGAAVQADERSEPVPAPKAKQSPLDAILSAESLAEALALAKPYMEDKFNADGLGTELLGAWAIRHMSWTDVGVANDETNFGLVQKDADEERGKRLCATGSVIQIAVVKGEIGKSFHGLLMSYSGKLYRFTAVGSSGELIERSEARVCGVVTGNLDYSNSGGGTGHAVKLVGMFDLPQNRPQQVAKVGR